MSLLAEMRKKYQAPISPTAKTAKGSYGSKGSEYLGGFENHELELAKEMIEIVQIRERGMVPDHYTATTECEHCGSVPIWDGCAPEVLGCPWCFNRHTGLPIPRLKKKKAL